LQETQVALELGVKPYVVLVGKSNRIKVLPGSRFHKVEKVRTHTRWFLPTGQESNPVVVLRKQLQPLKTAVRGTVIGDENLDVNTLLIKDATNLIG
jgi:hypothetical protein